MQPYAGGAPLVEIDFEVAGRTWRIRKQYLASKSATLIDLATGSVQRNADAETQLDGLLVSASSRAFASLLWVTQGTGLTNLAPDSAGQTTLRDLVAREVQTASDGGAAQRILASVNSDLSRYVTKATRKPTGDYLQALKAHEQATTAAGEATTRYAAAMARLDRLQDLNGRLAELATPALAAHRRAVLAQAEERSSAAEKAKRHFETADLEEKRARAEMERAAQALAVFERQLADLAAAEKSLATLEPELAFLTQQLADTSSRLAPAEAAFTTARACKVSAEQALRNAETAERNSERGERLCHLAAQLEQARDLGDRIATLGAALNAARVTREGVASLAAVETDIATLAARRAAAAPGISVRLLPSGVGRVRVGRRDVAAIEELSATAVLTIDIDGVGAITVTPANTGAVEAEREHALSAKRAALLAAVGFDDFTAAEAALAARDEIERDLKVAETSLTAVAPHGLAVLADAVTRLTAEAGSAVLAAPATGSVENARAMFLQASKEVSAAEAALMPLADECRRLRESVQLKTAKRDDAKLARAGLAEPLHDLPWREQTLVTLRTVHTAAVAMQGEKQREVSSWRTVVPDAAALGAMFAVLDAARSAIEQAAREERRISDEVRNVEGQLSANANEDAAELAQLAIAAQSDAAARVAAMKADVDALLLIERELRAAEDAGRSEILAPVLARIEPLLGTVFQGARISLDETFQPVGLARQNFVEQLDQLSLGTREQLAIIVRLGIARLLAERGTPVPLILDDALVYADDTRIAQMFALLQTAARDYQVIVLTCREKSFETLGGTRLELKPWRESETRA